ncbi:lmo0954 family membrane protein [Marinococcus luteus]|uniref:lmo0954 family membrane protein n=1 Tax=Marinococcus luteus TaxID=1122204 RepID=UPI002ACC75C2|nr:flagellar basal body rod protein [Marinococcus luteus]MDZ5782705.1 flagellar basal body rod protein [Marinococcus luteus]
MWKKIGLASVITIAAIIVLSNLGPLLLLAAGVALAYIVYRQFQESTSTAARVFWVIVGIAAILLALTNIYAVIALLGLYAIYWSVKKWSDDELDIDRRTRTKDPFTGFEEEWKKLKRR